MLRSAQLVTALSLATQLVGFLRTTLIAYALGISTQVDAYYLGLIAPSLLASVLSGVLQTGFVGRYAGFIATGDLDQSNAYRTRMILLVILISALLSTICALFPDAILGILLPSSQMAAQEAASGALRLTAWTIFPLIVADFFGLILNSHGKFLAAALAPLLNAAISVASLWVWNDPDLSALVATLLIGTFGQLAFVIIAFLRLHTRISLDAAAARGEVRSTLTGSLPILPAVFLANATFAVVQLRVAEIGEGAVAVLGYASRFHLAALQVVMIGLSTVLLPHVSALLARGETGKINRLYRRLVRTTVLVTLAISVGIILFGESVVLVLLGYGAFGPENAQSVGMVWAILGLGLLPASIGTFIAKLAQAQARSGMILVSSIISFSVVWLVSLVGARHSNTYLVAAASVGGMLATMLFWLAWLNAQEYASYIVSDVLNAVWRSLAILVPAIVADHLLTSNYSMDGLLAITVRMALFCLICAGTTLALRLQFWFFEPDFLRQQSGRGQHVGS